MQNARKTFVLSAAALSLLLGAAGATALRASDSAEAPAVSAELAQRDAQIAAWTNALRVDPSSAIALGQLAGLHLQRAREAGDDSDYSRAEDYARRSLALRVNRNAKSYVTLATALVAEHRFSEAEEVALQAVAYDRGVPEYAALVGEIKVELGDYDGARAIFDSLYRFRSSLSIAPRLARWAELTGNPEGAYRLLRRATDQAGKRRDIPKEQIAWFHYRLGDLELRQGRFNRARKEFEKGLVVEPADYRILTALARLSLLDGNPDDAIEYAEQSLSIKMDPGTLGILADAHLALGDSASAEENILAMEIAVRGQAGAYHRAWSLFLLDHNRRLDEVHRNAVAELETRKDIYGYDVLGWSLYRLGRYDEAALNMKSAMQLGTRDPMILYHSGMIEFARGNRETAAALLASALEINERLDHLQSPVARATLRKLR